MLITLLDLMKRRLKNFSGNFFPWRARANAGVQRQRPEPNEGAPLATVAGTKT